MSKMPKKVKVSPERAFFVKMITRDIMLEDSILDLIDNSIDAAWKQEGGHYTGLADNVDLSKYKISITADENEFIISDNCGGMSLDNAINHAFSFGRKNDHSIDDYSIGVYGIGMKRAVFKLGKKILIKSTPSSKTGFKVSIDVDAWLAAPNQSWNFNLAPSDPSSENGVVISASNLTPETRTILGDPNFANKLRQIIARDYYLHLKRGMTIEVNGEKTIGWDINFNSNERFKPTCFKNVHRTCNGTVEIQIIAGMASATTRYLEPSVMGKKNVPFGWYFICNGRVVLAADKTEISGWGTDLPKWHPQYNDFIGLAMFSAKNALHLPLTTTKRNVDPASSAFQEAKKKINEVSQAWISYANDRKARKQMGKEGKDEVKKLEASTKPISVYDIEPQKTLILPKFREKIIRKETIREETATVRYSVPQAKAKALAKGLGDEDLCYREIGLRSFKYAYERFAKKK